MRENITLKPAQTILRGVSAHTRVDYRTADRFRENTRVVSIVSSAGALLGLLFGLIALIRGRRAQWSIFAAVLAAAALYVGANVSDPISTGKMGRHHAATTSTFWKNSIHPRLYVAQIAATEMARRPWHGSGLGTFPAAFRAAERREMKEAEIPWWRFQRYSGNLTETSAHNDFVRIAVETGIPPALFWLGGCLALLWRLRRRPLARAMMLAFLVQSATDNFYSLANYIPLLWVALAYAAPPAAEADPPAAGAGAETPAP